jgi:hypothetical protein
MAVLAEVRKDPSLLALFLEPLERPLEALVIMDDDFWHSVYHPSRPGEGSKVNKLRKLRGKDGRSKEAGTIEGRKDGRSREVRMMTFSAPPASE